MRPCDIRLKCGHLCPFKVLIRPIVLTSPLLMVSSVIAMIQNTQPSFARSPAGGFVQEIILATSNALRHAVNACSLYQVSNFPVAM